MHTLCSKYVVKKVTRLNIIFDVDVIFPSFFMKIYFPHSMGYSRGKKLQLKILFDCIFINGYSNIILLENFAANEVPIWGDNL